jgi:hypothetical protein
MRIINTFLLQSLLLFCTSMGTPSAYAQCGITMSCGGPPKVCDVQVCFQNSAAKQQYESQNNCKIPNKGLCGDKPIEAATQCCGKDAKNGSAKIKDRQITQLDSKFDWTNYQKECPNMRQSEAPPDGLWRQCVVGQLHDPSDDKYNVAIVKHNPGDPKARDYCIDGCSTPPDVVKTLYDLGIFLIQDKDNPNGFPGSSFFNACAAHDICYQTCGKPFDQDTCDNRLLAQSLQACEVIPRNHISVDSFGDQRHTYNACRNAANKMNTGLYLGGKPAFFRRKQQYCQCC